jgi:ATP-dependent protease HslVU (ClpYQ) peptidase subunit
MTVIVGALTKKDGIVIAADSRVGLGEYGKEDGYPYKLWVDKENGYIFGGCGYIRDLQVLQYHVSWPEPRPKNDLMKFAVTEIVVAIKSGIEDHGIMAEVKKVHSLESSIIMAWEDNLIGIGGGFDVLPAVNGRIADGSGYAEAYGFLGDTGPWDKDDVIEAARRASITNMPVGGDFYWVSTKDMKVRKV